MGILSFLRKSRKLKCDWCGQEMEAPRYTKQAGNKTYNFCSETCKKSFRKSGKGKACRTCCPTCPLSR